MSYKSIMVIKAVVCLIFGIFLIAVPGTLFGILGITLTPGGAFPAREYAAALFGNLMLTWFARNAAASDARRVIILGLFVYDAIGFVVSLLAVLSGLLNPLGWFVVAVYLFFTITFGYLMTAKPKTAA
jgi:hypothetical protein